MQADKNWLKLWPSPEDFILHATSTLTQQQFTKNIGLLKKKINTGHFHIITTLTVLNIWNSQQSRPQALVVKYLLFSSHMLWNQTKAKLSEFPYSLSSLQ